MALQHLDLRPLVSRAVKEQIPVVSPQFVVLCYGSPMTCINLCPDHTDHDQGPGGVEERPAQKLLV